MFPYERDFLFARINAGYLRFRIKDTLYKFQIDKDLSYESEEVYYETFNKCYNDGCLTEEQATALLEKKGLWTEKDEEIFNGLTEDIEKIKVYMFENFQKKDDVERRRLFLNKAKEELQKLYETKHQIDYLTCAGAAHWARWQFIVHNCVTELNGNKVDWDNVYCHDVLAEITKSTVSEKQIREIARNDPWLTIWAIGRKTKNIFDGPPANYTDEQKRLISWAIYYDAAREREDSPEDDIFEDDDCFDGWMIIANRNLKKENKNKQIEKRIGKNINAQEVYIPVQCPSAPKDEDRLNMEDVASLNTPMANMVINSRINHINNNGPVWVEELPDIKTSVMMEKNRMLEG
jgi:hypothetical protein